MSIIAAHINDAGIAVLDAGRLYYREPGFALLDDDNLITGMAAFEQARIKPRRIHNRFWAGLTTEPMADVRFQHLSAADLVSRQLEQAWQQVGDRQRELALAVPAYMGKENLGLLLGIAGELDINVVALVDAAIAATRRQYKGAVPVHVELGLHSASLTRIAQGGQAQVDRAEVIEDCGLLALYDAWIRVIAEAFVQQSRFDPLHTADTEQALYNRLPGWLAAASGADKVMLDVEYQGISHHAELESLELLAAAAPIYHTLVSNLRAIYRADESPALQLSDRAARMPGLADILKARVGGEVFLLEPGATARGLLARCPQPSGAAISLVRHLPWDQTAVEVAALGTESHTGQPTHLLFENTAYALDTSALAIGSQPGDAERCIEVPQDMPGVSRRHCSLQFENGQCVVRDFSRYGTFLNGHRIDGSAVLQVGDRLRLGTPGFELRLITTEADGGA
jgi:hypothetical protein